MRGRTLDGIGLQTGSRPAPSVVATGPGSRAGRCAGPARLAGLRRLRLARARRRRGATGLGRVGALAGRSGARRSGCAAGAAVAGAACSGARRWRPRSSRYASCSCESASRIGAACGGATCSTSGSRPRIASIAIRPGPGHARPRSPARGPVRRIPRFTSVTTCSSSDVLDADLLDLRLVGGAQSPLRSAPGRPVPCPVALIVSPPQCCRPRQHTSPGSARPSSRRSRRSRLRRRSSAAGAGRR